MSSKERTLTINWEDPRRLAEAGRGLSGAEFLQKVNFIRAMTAGTGRVRAEAKLIHLGNRTATAEGRVIDDSGKLYAHGTTTCLILKV